MESFSNVLKELRTEKELSQANFAKIFNVSQNTIFCWEANKSEPNINTLKKLAKYFDVSLDYLCGRTTDINLKDEYQNSITKNERKLLKDFRAIPEQYQALCLSYVETIKNEFAKTNEGDLKNG